ncbi:uncharacterized protein PAC_12994 [Phialocephala subalpina]|uniref:Glycosyltransferase family 92 protein n=1 Tax=Phialocephala subalpina TaxID=576137 RepID=A0A1L7XDQ4_9HELO|nr:uncharacterized protein PAC_12994 [Phialocephala subalpina]
MEFFSKESGIAAINTIRWKTIGILLPCLVLIHYIVLAPPQKVLEAQKKVLSQIPELPKPPTLEDLIEHSPWAQFKTNASHPAGMDDGYAAICLSVKDQQQDLPEFLIHHYFHLGFRNFYIMDDGSSPPLSTLPDLGIPRSAVTFFYQERGSRHSYQQLVFYDHCLKTWGHEHEWIAFIDADEFLEVTSPNETFRGILESVIEKDDAYGALGVSWKIHSSSGLLTRPISARKSFTTCIYDAPEDQGQSSDNRHVKTIGRPSKINGPMNPHKFNLYQGAVTVGEHWDEVETIAFRQPITRDRLALHHYAVKSREEYVAKINRGNGMTDPKGEGFWEHIETMPHVNCPEMAQYDP